jgi:hypothetical protein
VLTVKVAHSAVQLPLALRERAGVRETAMAAATYIVWGGADAMAVPERQPGNQRFFSRPAGDLPPGGAGWADVRQLASTG